MKKIVFAVICGLFLVGCAKNEPKPASHEGCGCPHHKETKVICKNKVATIKVA